MAFSKGVTSFQPFNSCRFFSTLKVLPRDDQVIFENHGRKGLITLNRPKDFNALSLYMVIRLKQKLKLWDKEKELIVMKGAGGFCSGGDVKYMAMGMPSSLIPLLQETYRFTLALQGRAASLKTPLVAVMNGVTMGGGAALALHAKYQIVTERTIWALPENQIGFFPDAGLAYFMSSLSNCLGNFFMLTGYTIHSYDLIHAGLGTHFCLSEFLPQLESQILEENSNVEQLLHQYHARSLEKMNDSKEPVNTLAPYLEIIQDIFSAKSVDEIFEALEKRNDKFSSKILRMMKRAAPLSLKITHRKMQLTSGCSIYDVLNQDYRLARRFLANYNLNEGVRAQILDKDKNPKWRPDRIADVTDAEVDKFFEPMETSHELRLPDLLEI